MTKFLPVTVLTCLGAAVAIAWAAQVAPEPTPTKLEADLADIKTVGKETRGVFTGSVKLTGTNVQISADRIEILAESPSDKSGTVLPGFQDFKYIIATGHVRMTQGDRNATAGKVEILPKEEKVTLTEEPIVIIRGEPGKQDTVYSGESVEWTSGQTLRVIKPHAIFPEIKDFGFERDSLPGGSEKNSPASK